MHPSLVGTLGAILLVNITLSGDNAVVIGLAARNLSPKVRQRAIAIGGGLAIGFRLCLAIPAGLLLRLPLLQASGGALLAWIAYRLLTGTQTTTPSGDASTLFQAVQIMVLADLAMSLDNILAVAAVAERSAQPILMMAAGLAISTPIVLAGGSLAGRLMHRLPFLAWAGAALLGYVAGTLLTEDRILGSVVQSHTSVTHVVPPALAIIILALAWRHAQRAPSA
jgi:YjbE family integral membrane protein